MHRPNDSSSGNNKWYWNLNLHRDRLSLANTSAIDGTILPSSSAFYTSAVLTDVGICVGMRNVNLNCENQHCFYPRKIPNCFNNLNIVGEQNKQTWDHACNQIAFPTFGSANVATTTGPMCVHHSSVLPAPSSVQSQPSSQPSVTANSPATASVAYNFKLHNNDSLASSLFDGRLSFANHGNHIFSSPHLRTSAYPTIIEDPSHDTYHPYFINRSINCESNDSKMDTIVYDANMTASPAAVTSNVAAATVVVAAAHAARVVTPLIPSSPEPLKVLSPLVKNESHRRCHVAAPKKKWIRNYMLSNFVLSLILYTKKIL